MTGLHRLDGFGTRRIQQTDQAQQDESAREVVGTKIAGGHVRVLEPGERQHPFALGGEPVGFLREALAVEWRRLPVGDLLESAALDDDLRRAFDQQHLPAVGGPMERRHELVL